MEEVSLMADIAEPEAFEPYIVRGQKLGPYTVDLWITEPVAAEWYDGRESFDTPEFVWLLAHLREGMKVADCGAHHGLSTIAFSKAVGPSGIVGAWEAFPPNADVIEKNLALNGCDNVVVRPLALGDENKTVRLWTHTSNSLIPWSEPIYGNTEVQMVRLDDEIPSDIKADLIKLDVEGSELHVLRGAGRVLSARPIIDLELHCHWFEDRNATLAEIFSLLQPLGYVYSVLSRPNETIRAVGWNIDLAELAFYENPHVFCIPVW
jgi:FkbM family methyltransferase